MAVYSACQLKFISVVLDWRRKCGYDWGVSPPARLHRDP